LLPVASFDALARARRATLSAMACQRSALPRTISWWSNAAGLGGGCQEAIGSRWAALETMRLERRSNGCLQVSQRNLDFLRGVEPLEELVEGEGDVVGLLLLVGMILLRCLRR
jgi:hypothetical protein